MKGPGPDHCQKLHTVDPYAVFKPLDCHPYSSRGPQGIDAPLGSCGIWKVLAVGGLV